MDRCLSRSSAASPKPPRRQPRREFLALAAVAACLPACSRSTLLELVGATVDDVFFPSSAGPGLTRQRVENIPQPSIAVKIGQSPRALLVLGRTDGSNLHWYSPERASLVTGGGRLVKTAGLPANLEATGFYDADPLAEGMLLTAATGYRLRRWVDLQPGNRFGVRVDSTFETGAPETTEILGASFDTLRIRERSEAPAIGWKFTNTYWADRETGFVWKSVQHFVPELPPAEIEILKAAG